jgi:hypothetical protein
MTRSGAIAVTTGTVYGLIDPRDKVIRYVGKTTQPLTQRLTGHYSGAAAQRVRTWVAELRAAGLKPLISPIRENVPVPDLDAAERWEITRILAAGGRLLNSTLTSQGRKLNEDRLDAEHTACWARLAGEARALLGGPFPPGDLTALVIPGETWRFMRQVLPGHRERVEALLEPGQPEETFSDRYQAWKDWQAATSLALRHLWAVATSAWSDVLRISPGTFATNMKAVFSEVVQTHWDNMEDASRLLALAVWYMVAVEPWRHLAEIGGLPLDSAPFIRWAGRDAGTRARGADAPGPVPRHAAQTAGAV